MNPTKIVVREMQRDGSFQVRQFARKGICQACKPADRHSHTEVLPLHVASRNVAHARVSDLNLGYNLRDSWWGVSPFIMLPKVAEQFHELGEVHIDAEHFFYDLCVEVESVRGYLHLIR